MVNGLGRVWKWKEREKSYEGRCNSMGRITSNVQYHSWITVIDMFPNSYYRGF